MPGPFDVNTDETEESGESLGSNLGPEVPQPDSTVPETPSPDVDYADVDPKLRALFWKLVLLYKVSILGTSLGVLLLIFDAGPNVGFELLAGGLVLLGYTLYQSKRAKERIDAGEFDTPEDSQDGEATERGNETTERDESTERDDATDETIESGDERTERDDATGETGDAVASDQAEGEP